MGAVRQECLGAENVLVEMSSEVHVQKSVGRWDYWGDWGGAREERQVRLNSSMKLR